MIAAALDNPGVIARWSFCAVVAVALQDSVVWKLSVAGVHPELPLLLAVTAGVVIGARRGCIAGFWIGLLFDAVSGSMVGLSAFTYGVAGYAAGAADDRLMSDSPFVRILHISGASSLAILIQALVGEVFGRPFMDGSRFLVVALIVGLWHLPLGLPAMAVVEWAEPEDR